MFEYKKVDVAEGIRCYSSSNFKGSVRFERDEDYARARAGIPTFCLDGLICGKLQNGQKAILLIQRTGSGDSAGPFRELLWVAGGRWDMVTPWKEFVAKMVMKEVFSKDTGEPQFEVGKLVGDQFFCTGWAENEDGPYGYSGMTVQYCYEVFVQTPLDELKLKTDENHGGYVFIEEGKAVPALHPYIRDLIELCSWNWDLKPTV